MAPAFDTRQPEHLPAPWRQAIKNALKGIQALGQVRQVFSRWRESRVAGYDHQRLKGSFSLGQPHIATRLTVMVDQHRMGDATQVGVWLLDWLTLGRQYEAYESIVQHVTGTLHALGLPADPQ
ncbi:hypothetical protein D3C76_1370550 [compost metagenome]